MHGTATDDQQRPRSTFDPALKVEVWGIHRASSGISTESLPKGAEPRKTGAIIRLFSQRGRWIFPPCFIGRVANIVPVDRIEDALDSFSAATKAAGIFPHSLRSRLRDRGATDGWTELHNRLDTPSSSLGRGTKRWYRAGASHVQMGRWMCRADPGRGRGGPMDAGAGDRSLEEGGRELATARRGGNLMQYFPSGGQPALWFRASPWGPTDLH